MRFKVLMPMYKSMNVSCVISLIDFLLHLRDLGHDVAFGCTNGFNAAKARKALVKDAAEKAAKPGKDKFRAIYPKQDSEVCMVYAEEVGLGSRKYELIEL